MIGASFGIYASSVVGGFDPAASAIIAQMIENGSTPSEARQAVINQLVLDLKGTGNTGADDVWSRLDILNVHAAADAIQAQTQWINSDGTYDSVQVGTPTFTADVGFSSTNVANRIDPIWKANALLGNYTLNNASVGFYGTVEDARYFLGNANLALIRMRAANGSPYESCMNSPFVAGYVDFGSLDGLFIFDRNSSTGYKAFTDTTEVADVTKTSTSLASDQIRYPYGGSTGGSQTAKIVFFGASVRDVLPQLKASFDAYLAAL